MDLLIGEGLLPVMHAEELFDSLLEFGVVFDPGESGWYNHRGQVSSILPGLGPMPK